MASLASLDEGCIYGYDNLNEIKLILKSRNGRPHMFKNHNCKMECSKPCKRILALTCA